MVYTEMTEKRKPTYDLEAFKAVCGSVETLPITVTATRTARQLGFTLDQVVAILQTMQRAQFYKSMTSYGDHRVWQDVYHVPSSAGILYVKFTAELVSDFLLLSFKEKGND